METHAAADVWIIVNGDEEFLSGDGYTTRWSTSILDAERYRTATAAEYAADDLDYPGSRGARVVQAHATMTIKADATGG